MNLADFNKMKKCMDRTFSENDAEALASIRAANKLIAAQGDGLDWSKVLDRVIRLDVESSTAYDRDPRDDRDDHVEPSKEERDARVNEAFQTVLDDLKPGSFRDVIMSFNEQWTEKGFLSPKQREVLFKAMQRAGERR